MKELATVLEKRGKKALVMIKRNSACQKCNRSCSMAGNSPEASELKMEVDNPIGAAADQVVKVEMKEKSVVMASLIVYLLPLLGLFTGYFAGSLLGSNLDFLTSQMAGITGSVIFFILTIFVIKITDKKLAGNSDYQPRIVEIVERKEIK